MGTIKDAKCTELRLVAPVFMAAEEDKNEFSIEAYTGAVVDRWYGKLAISVDGIIAKKQIPVLMNHDTNQIVGFSTNTRKDGSFFVDGNFSKVTDKGKEVKGLIAEGFPWQASIGVRPLKILSLERDAESVVNGETLAGPAEVWLESEVFETSFVPLGADGNTSVSTFSKFTETEAPTGETNNIEEDFSMDFTLENLKKEAPDLLNDIEAGAKDAGHQEGIAAGTTQERERVAALMAIEGADEASKIQAVNEGLSVDSAYKLFFEAEKGKKAEDLKALEDSTPDSAGHKAKETGGDEKTFMQAVDDYQSDKKCTRTEALTAIAKASPELHQKSMGRK